MRKSWQSFFRRIAGVCFVCGASAWSSALCYAQVAADNASDPVYANGWQAGDNGGFGFGPWDFTGTYDSMVQHAINSTSPFNQIGTAWTLYNPDGPEPNSGGGGSDISQAGRAILGNFQPGQTLSVLIDNPIERRFFRGYTFRLNTGGGNTVYNGRPESRLAIGTFEYQTNGRWYATGTGGNPPFFDTDTDQGLRIDVTLTDANSYDLVMTPLDNPTSAFMTSGKLEGSGPINWIEFEMYNTDSDFYPIQQPQPQATDFYIRSIQITTPEIVWNLDANGDWSNSANWAGGQPNGVGVEAKFLGVITAPRTVAVDRPRTVGSLIFDNANSYTLGGPGPLTIESDEAASITVRSGSHTISAPLSIAASETVTKNGPGALTISGTQSHGAGAMLVAAEGVTNLNSDAGSNLSLVANADVNLGSNQRIAGLQIGSGATVQLTSGPSKTLHTPTLAIAGTPSEPTATLDVNSNAAIVDYSGTNPAATIRQQILAGRGAAGIGGPWDGEGITSSAAAAANAVETESRALGYANNGDLPLGSYTNYRGQPVDGTSVLIAFTRTGDANLDGVVNDDDVTILGATYAPGVPNAEWAFGDFDYNGFVDDDDVTLLGAFYDPGAPPIAAPAGPGASGVAAVPEPHTLVLMVLAFGVAVALAGARKKGSQ